MAGTFPNVAQSPSAIRIWHRSRIILATSMLCVLQMAPSSIPTVTPSFGGCFRSVIGLDVISTDSNRFTIRSSMSKSDMWHPAQPASQSVAILTFVIVDSPLLDFLNGQSRNLVQRRTQFPAQFFCQQGKNFPVRLGASPGFHRFIDLLHTALRIC